MLIKKKKIVFGIKFIRYNYVYIKHAGGVICDFCKLKNTKLCEEVVPLCTKYLFYSLKFYGTRDDYKINYCFIIEDAYKEIK